MSIVLGEPDAAVRRDAFTQRLAELGWSDGTNLRIDYGWAGPDTARYREFASELLAKSPDVLLAANTSTARALKEQTTTVPIVFAAATDPVGGGLVASLALPGANVTGFSQRDFNLSAKHLELLKQIAPRVSRVAILRNPATTGSTAQFAVIQTAAPRFNVELTAIDVRTPAEIEHGIASLTHSPNGGLIVTSTSLALTHRMLIIRLAAMHRLPVVFPWRRPVTEGALASYGPDLAEGYRGAAGYVDRILRGEKPATLPVQQLSKFELVVNLTTAKALGLTIPKELLLRADEVIQ